MYDGERFGQSPQGTSAMSEPTRYGPVSRIRPALRIVAGIPSADGNRHEPTGTRNPELLSARRCDATRRHDNAAQEFVRSGQLEDPARAGKPASSENDETMKRAERANRAHSTGGAPATATPPAPM
ncbi:MAG: hypothetical protein KGL99_02725 [Burkholderiales bacterium]|nr:hypothetical protein [Burkholderiales bacterium]